MTIKTAIAIGSCAAAIVILILIILGLASHIYTTAEAEAELQREKELNQTIADSFFAGANQATLELFNAAYEQGMITITIGNDTLALYSPDGCVAAIQQAQGGG